MGRRKVSEPAPRPPLFAIAAISCGALGYEILLAHLLSTIHWHHFAAMVISLALLGYGISGVFLALFRSSLARYFPLAMAANALLFSLTAIGAFLLVQKIPLNPLELPWNPRKLFYLPVLYLLPAIPFFAAANCIGLALGQFHAQSFRVYAADLGGAGGGALLIILLLFLIPAEQALVLTSLLGMLAAGRILWGTPFLKGRRGGILILSGIAILLGLSTAIELKPAPYKDLSKALTVMGSEEIHRESSPLGRISVLQNLQVPFRQAPGMSIVSRQRPPEQLALFIDGNGAGAINRFDGRTPPRFVENLSSALPYRLLRQPRVLILGSGGGTALLQALHFESEHIDSVESNPQLVEMLQGRFKQFAGNLYNHPSIRIHSGEPRAFVAAAGDKEFDLVMLNPADGFGSSSTGLGAQAENFLYTIEAVEAYLAQLAPGGILTFNRWLHLPPRDNLRLVSIVIEALRRQGLADPGRRIAMIRGWRTSTLLVKPAGIGDWENERIRSFCRELAFDPVYFPGIGSDEVNRHNRLQSPLFHAGVKALLGAEAGRFIGDYKFDIAAADDNRPYFFNFAKWRALPELLDLPAHGGLGQLDLGYWALVLSLLQALAASLLFIMLPLWLLKRRQQLQPASSPRPSLRYFALLGLAFMFLEIAFIQRFTLLLGHPLLALSVVLAGFLVFAGIGSLWSGRLAANGHRSLLWVAIAIGLISGLYLTLFPHLLGPLQGLPLPLRVASVLLLIALPAVPMGMPFPIGIARLGKQAPSLMPYAWGINGIASVNGAVLAALLAVEIGFSGLVLAAAVLYVLAALSPP